VSADLLCNAERAALDRPVPSREAEPRRARGMVARLGDVARRAVAPASVCGGAQACRQHVERAEEAILAEVQN
jgi:hypothetical protein